MRLPKLPHRLSTRLLALATFGLAPTFLAATCNPLGAPKPPRFIDDSDPERARVTMTKQASDPFVVDWEPEHRADLEVETARNGPGIVHFDTTTFRLLPQCHAKGRYNYTPVVPKEQHKSWHTRAELHANLPMSAFQLESLLGTKGGVNVSLRMVGKRVLEQPTVSRGDLFGQGCEQATHYVQALTVGAFRFEAGAQQQGGVTVGVIGGPGVGGQTGGVSQVLQVDGDFVKCDEGGASGDAPPPKCSAILRIQLVPLDGAQQETPAAQRCGEGMRWDGEACVSAGVVTSRVESGSQPPVVQRREAQSFECDPKNSAECLEQCKHGNRASCVWLGHYLAAGSGGLPRDEPRALAIWKDACGHGIATGCAALSGYYQERRNDAEALEYGKRGCSAGDAGSCTNVGVLAYFGRGITENRDAAFGLWTRACKLREWNACNNAGVMILFGRAHVPKNLDAARKLFELACASPGKEGCVNLATLHELGLGVPKDLRKAAELYLDACKTNHALGCVMGGLVLEEHNASAKKNALQLYESACDMPGGGGCSTEKELREDFPGVYSAEGYERRACDGADAPALGCINAAIGHLRGYDGHPDRARAISFLKRACERKSDKACTALRKASSGETRL